jgi:ribosomal protein S18 acetylase RimI-like enzyme
MASTELAHVRPLRRGDLARLADLRLWYLAETARLEPRLRLVPDARERLPHAVSVWLGQQERVVLVAEDASGATPAGEEPPIVGYGAGAVAVWPPIFRAQRVGELGEIFVVPDRRRHGVGRALLQGVLDALVARGVDVLRAPVPVRNDGTVALFRSLGFDPVLRIAERSLAGGR